MAKAEEQADALEGLVKNKRRPGYSRPSDPVNTSGENDESYSPSDSSPAPLQPPDDAGAKVVAGRATSPDAEQKEIRKRAAARFGRPA